MHEHELSAIPRDARGFQGQRAGVVTRFVGAGIDAVVIALVLVGGYLGYAGLRFLVDPRSFTFPDPQLIVCLMLGALLLGVYLTVAWAATGRTYGDLLMGLRVVGVSSGGDVGWLRSALRAACYVCFPIGLLWVAVDRQQRSIQDRLVGTAVVYDWKPRVARRGA